MRSPPMVVTGRTRFCGPGGGGPWKGARAAGGPGGGAGVTVGPDAAAVVGAGPPNNDPNGGACAVDRLLLMPELCRCY